LPVVGATFSEVLSLVKVPVLDPVVGATLGDGWEMCIFEVLSLAILCEVN